MAYIGILAALAAFAAPDLLGTRTNLVTAVVVVAVLFLRGALIRLFSNSDRR